MSSKPAAAHALIEVDLPSIIEVKRNLAERLGLEYPAPALISASVLDEAAWEEIGSHLSRAPSGKLAIICEGLMRYLSFEEKKRLASFVRSVLLQRDGVWVTCDVTLSQMLADEAENEDVDNESLMAIVAEDQIGNAFSSINACLSFFEDAGFEVRHFSASADQKIISQALKIFPDVAPELVGKYVNVLELSAK